jgi:UDP-N-acetylglucosamine 2-epimerase (non-hydrolysing)
MIISPITVRRFLDVFTILDQNGIMLKVMTIVGTRPEIIRLSRIMPAFDKHFSHIIVHTGQNNDPGLKDIFFADLNLRQPDHFLLLDNATIGKMLSGMFQEIENVILKEKPDAVLILGDTNSALSCIIARKLGVPIYHMEAGNRCFDNESPEETNRRIVDHTCDFNLAYTESARRNLLREGLHPSRVYVTGSPINEVIQHYRNNIHENNILEKLGLGHRKYFAASIHRQETVDNIDRLTDIFSAFRQLHETYGLPIILSTHPRTKQKLGQFGIALPDCVISVAPMGYFEWCRLQISAACVISDSGTLSEEAAILNFPAVTPRKAMERPEALESGSVIICGISPGAIVPSVTMMMTRSTAIGRKIPDEYEVPDVSHRVAALITGTCRLSRTWPH